MTIYHVDPVNGNDTNNGLSWSTAYKTLNRGSTTGSTLINYFHPGDIVKIAKSPDPVEAGIITWNKDSFILNFDDPLVKKLDYSYRAAVGWIASTYITYTLPSGGKCVLYSYGSVAQNYYAKFVIGSSFTTGKIAYESVPSYNTDPPYDFSGYTKISFWIRVSVAIPASRFKICLCSDTIGNTIVDEFFIPAIRTDLANRWVPITLTNGTALGSSLQSIALYAVSDPGLVTIDICDIIACNNLTYTCLISKNSLATGGEEAWYPIDSILDNRIALATIANKNYSYTLTVNMASMYSGVTETVRTFARESLIASSNNDWLSFASGEPDNFIEFQGGYNTLTDEQDGETFYDYQGAKASGFYAEGQLCFLLNRLNPIRAYRGIYLNECALFKVTANTLCGNSESGIKIITQEYVYRYAPVNYSDQTLYNNSTLPRMVLQEDLFENYVAEIDILNLVNNEVAGIICETVSNSRIKIGWISGGSGDDPEATQVSGQGKGIFIDRVYDSVFDLGFCRDLFLLACSRSVINADEIKYIQLGVDDDVNYDYYVYSGTEKTVVQNCKLSTIYLKFTSDRVAHHGSVVFRNCALDESFILWDNSLPISNDYLNRKVNYIAFEKINGDITQNRIYYSSFQIAESQTLVRHSSPGVAWKLAYISAPNGDKIRPSITNYFSLSLAKVVVTANTTITFSAWFLRKSEFVIGRLICRSNVLLGLNKSVQSKMTVGADIWEKLSVTITPVESGVVEIEARITQDYICQYYPGGVYSPTGYDPLTDSDYDPTIYVDDFSYEG